MPEKVNRKKLIDWMKKSFMPDSASGWNSTLHIHLKGEQPLTADFKRKAFDLSQGLEGEPLSTITTDSATMLDVLMGTLPLDIAIMRGTLSADNMIEVFKLVSVFRPEREGKKAVEKKTGKTAKLK